MALLNQSNLRSRTSSALFIITIRSLASLTLFMLTIMSQFGPTVAIASQFGSICYYGREPFRLYLFYDREPVRLYLLSRLSLLSLSQFGSSNYYFCNYLPFMAFAIFYVYSCRLWRLTVFIFLLYAIFSIYFNLIFYR